jgi:pilus assembly protein CpaB
VKNPRRFLIALIVAFIATFAQCRYIKIREDQLLYDSELLPTLKATQNIPARFKLDETMVEVIEVPRKWRQPKALSEVEDILGQITSNPIIEGEQIISTKLVKPDEAGLAFYVPKKLRAIAIAVDRFTAVGGHVKPGNYVDVMGAFDFGQGEKSDIRTVTLFQNVWVLSVGKDIGQPTVRTLADGNEEVVKSEQGDFDTITLAVTPEEAQKIILAQQLGDLTLSLRSLWETERFVKIDHATIHSTLGIPQKVRYRQRPSWQIIRTGGY